MLMGLDTIEINLVYSLFTASYDDYSFQNLTKKMPAGVSPPWIGLSCWKRWYSKKYYYDLVPKIWPFLKYKQIYMQKMNPLSSKLGAFWQILKYQSIFEIGVQIFASDLQECCKNVLIGKNVVIWM